MMKRELKISLDGTTEQVSAEVFCDLVNQLSQPDTPAVGRKVLEGGAVLSWEHVATTAPQPVTEAELVAAAVAPRVTADRLDAVIRRSEFFQPEGTTLTVCVLHLANGFTVVGESAAASPDNFNPEIGQRIALANAKNKVWPLEGYLLRTLLHAQNDGIAVELGLRLDGFLSAECGDALDSALAELGKETNSIGIVQQVLTDLWDITGRAAPKAEG